MRWFRVNLNRHSKKKDASVLIISFPKSGRTWLRVLLGKAISDQYDLDQRLLLDTFAVTKEAGLRLTNVTHNDSSRAWKHPYSSVCAASEARSLYKKRIVFLVREPRDVLVSCFFEITKRKDGYFDGTISEFIRDDFYGMRKIMAYYKAWDQIQHMCRKSLVVRYEDMHMDTNATLCNVLNFISANVEDSIVSNAVEFSSFENMKKMESENSLNAAMMRPGNLYDQESRKVRKGKIGNYVHYLNQHDQDFAKQVIAEANYPFCYGLVDL